MSTYFSTSQCMEAIQDLYRNAEIIDKRARRYVGDSGDVDLFLRIRKPFEDCIGSLMYDIIRYQCNDLTIDDLKIKIQKYHRVSQHYLNTVITLAKVINPQNS